MSTNINHGPKLHRKSGLNAVARIKRCFDEPFGNHPLSKITPIQIDQWRSKRLKDGLSTETLNRDVATFKAALSKAVLWGFLPQNPLNNLKLFTVDSTVKVRYLSENEEKKLRCALDEREQEMKAARERYNEWRTTRGYEPLPSLVNLYFADDLKPKILLSINTGIRRGELINLHWSNVNLEQNFITIVGDIAKSGKTRHIPLNQEALTLLKEWRKQTSNDDWVFFNEAGNQYDNWYKAWNNLLKKIGLANCRWHDLRHHFASRLVMSGVDLNTVRELLGHSDIKMTLRYAHLAPEHKIQAVAKLVRNEKEVI